MDFKLDLSFDPGRKCWKASVTLNRPNGSSMTRHAFSKDGPEDAASTAMRELVGEAMHTVSL